MGNQPYIVGVGAANLDLNGASCAPLHLRDSNPGHISLSAGGVTRNVCENLARLGADVKLLSCVGDDVFGSYIRRSCVEAGIDIRYLHEARGAHSSIYLSILDADGDMLVGMSDMRIVQQDLPADYLPSQKQLIQGAKVSVLLYHRSAPASSGRTSFSASMPTSSMESSGSLVVKFWNHMPGAVRIRVSQLSWRPTRRLNS